MHRIASAICLLLLAITGCFAAETGRSASAGGFLYAGTWPHHIAVIDEAKQKVVDKIELKTGIPLRLEISADRKKLYAITLRNSGIETIDLATRKVISSFELDQGNRKEKIAATAVDPSGQFIYSIVSPAVRESDHFEIEPPHFIKVDLTQQKIVKTAPFPQEEDIFGATGLLATYYGGLKTSPDGKRLYLFRNNIYVFDTTEFKLVDKIELARTSLPGMMGVSLQLEEDPNEPPGVINSVFTSIDPHVRRPVFGLARVDMGANTVDFAPVAPNTTNIGGFFVSPDRKKGYAVSVEGEHGNRRTEFWVFDMETKTIVQRATFPGRRRFSFAMSSNGKDLYIYGAGFEVDVYDASTLKLKKTIDVNSDVTTDMIVVPGA